MNGNILVIDDKPKIFDSLSKNFKSLGYFSYYAANNKDALQILIDNHIDVVLLDLKLGEHDGRQVLENIKKFNANIPVIIITGYATIETAIDTMKLGAKDYIKKPLDFDNLFKIVENAIRSYRIYKEHGDAHISTPHFITT